MTREQRIERALREAVELVIAGLGDSTMRALVKGVAHSDVIGGRRQ